MRIKALASAAVALTLMASAATAGTHVGWYVAADGGVHQSSAQHVTITDATIYSQSVGAFSGSSSSSDSLAFDLPSGPAVDVVGQDFTLKTKPGAAGFVRAGYQFNPHWRVEAEVGDRLGKVKELGEGHTNISTQMLNVLYDFIPEKDLHPFVGLGAGQATTKTMLKGNVQSVNIGGYDQDIVYKINSKTTNTAWQAIAGLSWALSDHMTMDLTYRYLDGGKVRYDVTADSTYNVAVDDGCGYEEACGYGCDYSSACYGGKASPTAAVAPRTNAAVIGTAAVSETDILVASPARIRDNSITLGLRWSFGGGNPPPPAMPMDSAPEAYVPPPPPVDNPVVESYGPQLPDARTFTVYFNFDRSSLTDEARQVVNAAATYAMSAPSPSVTVTGHTDTSGSRAYNVRLSEKRANAVAEGLTDAGVSASSIKLGWTGEDDLAVPTGNGVKNPENRRTTIDITF